MATFEQLFDYFKTVSYEEKVRVTKNIYRAIIDTIDKYRFGNFFVPAQTAAVWYFANFCSVDRKITYAEHKFFVDVTGNYMSYDEFFNECREDDHPEMKADLQSFMKKINDKELGYFQTLAAVIFSLKGNPTYEEKNYLLNYFS